MRTSARRLLAGVAGALTLLPALAAALEPPSFPWDSLPAIEAERPNGEVYLCREDDRRTRVAALLIPRGEGFFRVWAALARPDWVAIRYDEDARPEWVWQGRLAGTALRVDSVVPFDRGAHGSACDVLFGADGRR